MMVDANGIPRFDPESESQIFETCGQMGYLDGMESMDRLHIDW